MDYETDEYIQKKG